MKEKKSFVLSLIIIISVLAITLLLAKVAKDRSRLETNLDEYMPQDHPAFVYSNEAEEWFNIKDAVLLAIYNKDGVFNYSTLYKVKKLTKELGKMKEIRKEDITSLYTADNIVGTEDGLDVRAFYRRVPKSPEKLKKIRDMVVTNEMVFGKLVSKDEKVTLIIARIDDDSFSQDFYRRVLELAKKYEGPEKIYVAGRPIVEGTLAYLMPKDMKKMVPIVIVFIIAVLWFLLKSFKNTITTLLVVLFSTVWTFGLMALFGVPIYAVSTMIPVMLIAIGVAYGVHLYSHLELYIKENPDVEKLSAIKNMISEMWKPVMMAAVTTMVGFISLLTSEVYPVKYFGIFSALGVLFVFILSILFIPAVLDIFGLPKFKEKKENERSKRFYFNITGKIIKAKKAVVVLTIIIVLLSIYGITKVWVSSSFLAKFEKDSDIVKTDKFVNEHFGGTTTFNVILEGEKKDTFKRPEVLRKVYEMQKKVDDSLEVVGDSFSLSDFIRRMNKVMHADKEEFNTIPDDQNLIAQYLLLYEMSGDPENLWRVVDEKYKKANVSFQLKSDDSQQIKKVIKIIETFKDDFSQLGIKINYAGSGYKALVFTDLLLEGQISSLVLSLFIVIILLTIMFRNFIVGIIGSIPIAITAIINFGVMGFAGIPLSSTTALISSIAIGIGIDYAIHFLDRYRIYAKEFDDKDTISKNTMYHSGRAILYNAMVVIAGFMVLVFSVFPPNRNLGELVSLNMFTSFLGTLTIMFILVYMTNLFLKNRKKEIKEVKK